jgi:RNA polymerase sigma-70 factor (ECF subfamily)
LKNSWAIKELIYQIADGNTDAFGKFYDIYFHKVYQFTGYFIKSDKICEEIVSDVFLTLWITREKLIEIENLDAFIYTITKNKAYNYLNKIARDPDFTSDFPIDITGDIDSPEDIVLTEELKQVIKSSIDELPERCKLIFLMSREEGLRYQDIAQILSISEKTVNAQIVTALKKLHAVLKKYLTVLV